MKTLFIALIVIILAAVGGFFGWQYLQKPGSTSSATTISEKTGNTTKEGTLKAAVPPGDDYTHILYASDGTVKLNSYSVKLKDYEGQKVSVTGQYSGNTLFVDTITVSP